MLTALAGIVVAIGTLVNAWRDVPLPPLSWIAGNRLLGIMLLAAGGLAVLAAVNRVPGRPVPPGLRMAGLIVLYVIMAILVARICIWPAPSVSITAPRTGAVIATPQQTVEGTWVGPVADKLWIVVQVASPNREGPHGYFPQEGPVPTEQDGNWKAQITVGDGSSAHESFLVLAVLANTSEAQTKFQDFIAACGTGGCPQALTRLPDDVAVLDQISVARA